MRDSAMNSIGGRALHVSFSNDCKYFSVATEDGVQIRNAASCDIRISLDVSNGASSAAMLDNSQILGLSGVQTKENVLSLLDSVTRKRVGRLTVDEPIVRAVLTSRHICIIGAQHVNLYSHSKAEIVHIAKYDTCHNEKGVCVLGQKFCLFPARSAGQIQIIQLGDSNNELRERQIINHRILPAHTSVLRALCLTRDEEIICSASANGTLVRLHSTNSGAKLGELRRGVGSATIYSLAASPSGGQLAVTSDTNTLHIFNLPTSHLQADPQGSQQRPTKSIGESGWQAVDRSPSPAAVTPESANGSYLNWQKWGSLAKIPFAPRVFSDVYSFVNAAFDPGKDEDDAPIFSRRASGGWAGSVAQSSHRKKGLDRVKGLVGWVDDETLVMLSAGRDARYERFKVDLDNDSPATLQRVGWSRYMKPN